MIGNPPYVDIKALPKNEVRRYFQIFKTVENRINLYSIFLEKGSSLLNSIGILSYINPNSILVNESYRKIRKYLLDGVEKIIKLPDSVFETATVETIILFTRSKSKKEHVYGAFFSKNEIIDFSNLNFLAFPRIGWKSDEDCRFSIFGDDSINSLLGKIQKNSVELEMYVQTSLGITPYDKYKGHSPELIKNKSFHSSFKESDEYVGLISGRNIHPYFISNQITDYLKYGNWLGAPREKKFFESTKIIVRQILSGNQLKIIAGFSTKPTYFTQIGFSLISKTGNDDELKLLLALLNSNLLSFYHKHKFLDVEKVVFQKILIANCKKLPIRIPNNKDRILELIDKIIIGKEQGLSQDFENIQNEIDILIYHLYELTFDEARLIDENLSMTEFNNYLE